MTFNDHAVDMLAVSLTQMAWIFLRMKNSRRDPMIECVWLSLATLSSLTDELEWEWAVCQIEVLGSYRIMPLGCCPQAQFIFH